MIVKRILIILVLLAVGVSAHAADRQQILDKVDELIRTKKYQTAAEFLLKDNQAKKEPELFLKYVMLVTNYYAHAFNFKMFAMRDLTRDEDIMKVRGTIGDFIITGGDIEEDIQEMEKKYPRNGYINFAIGYYISRAVSCGCEGGLTHYATDFNNEYKYLKSAFDHKLYDDWTLFRLGQYNQEANHTELAKKFYDLSLVEGSDNPDLFYNYAIIDFQSRDYSHALNFVDKAIKGYTEKYLLADSYHLKGVILNETGESKRAQEQYKKGLDIVAWHTENFKSLASLLKRAGKRSEYVVIVKKYIALDYSNSFLFNNYLVMLEEEGISDVDMEIERYLISLENLRSKEIGALYFNLGRFAEMNQNKDDALKRYRIALNAFSKVEDIPDGAIEALEMRLSELEKISR